MSVLIIFCIALAILYTILMLLYRLGWQRQKAHLPARDFQPRTKISVIIPARNEAANIAACIQSVLRQDYPPGLLEVIVVDDHSDDDTAALATAAGEARVCVLRLKERMRNEGQLNAFKKKALATGIAESSGELIVTTDADCIVRPHWLKHMVAVYEQDGAVMIVGPVAFTNSRQLIAVFQSLDFMMMQGITAAAHKLKLGSMANGANLAFARSAYEAVGGYEGTTHLASGDDYLLLHKIEKAFPGRVQYLKAEEAIVSTAPQPTWGTFLQQRIRWASKSGKYSDYRLTVILAVVYLFNVSIPAVAVACFFQAGLWRFLATILTAKILSELMLLYPVSRFYRKERELIWFPFLQPLHMLYIILAGFFGMKGGYRWKGRKVK